MNNKMIAGIVMVLGSIVCGVLVSKADRKYLAEKAVETVQNEKCQDDIQAYENAKKAVKLRNDVLKRENDEVKALFAKWKKETRFDQKKKDAYFAEDKALKEFKDSVGYGEALAKLSTEKQESLDAFRTSIGYDDKILELKEAIKDAENKWKSQEKLFSSADDDISDTASKLKHAAEDAKDAAVKKAKDQIADLEKQLKAETDIWEKKIQKTTREFEEKINREKNRLHAKTQKTISDLDAESDLAHKDILQTVCAKRTDEEFDAVSFFDDNEKLIRLHDDTDAAKAYDIFLNTPKAERIGWWFKQHKWPRWCVAIIWFIPVAACEYLIGCYGRFIIDILRAMA